MIRGRIFGSREEIARWMELLYPELPEVMGRVASRVPFIKRQIDPYQGEALYAITKALAPQAVLEIGTAWGYSAAILAEAAPEAAIITLNPKEHEVIRARQHLAAYPNVAVIQAKSWDMLNVLHDRWDMVWIDGDHRNVRLDLPWFNRLMPNGLMLFHDYSPDDSARPCQVVYDEVNALSKQLGREPDVLIIDTLGVGMAGFYRREGDTYYGDLCDR